MPILLLVIIALLVGGLWLCFRLGILDARVRRSAEEVIDFLQSSLDGRLNSYEIDVFEHIPIKDAGLDEVRARYAQLNHEYSSKWNAEQGFPLEYRLALIELIQKTRSMEK